MNYVYILQSLPPFYQFENMIKFILIYYSTNLQIYLDVLSPIKLLIYHYKEGEEKIYLYIIHLHVNNKSLKLRISIIE